MAWFPGAQAAPVQYFPLSLEQGSPLPPAGVVHYVDEMEDENMTSHLCGAVSQRPGGLWYAESMDLSNDPRFMGDTILDKRLAAFTALSIIASISTGAVCDNFFPFLDSNNLKFLGAHQKPWDFVRGLMQLAGFLLMSLVLFLDVVATIVFGAQFYYTYKLMTSGPVGFESARGFYKDPKMTEYRSRAALGLIIGLPLFLLSIGCMIYVKFDLAEADRDTTLRHIVCLGSFAIFLCMALCVLRVGMDHQRVFSSKCRMSSSVTPLLQRLEAQSSPRCSGR